MRPSRTDATPSTTPISYVIVFGYPPASDKYSVTVEYFKSLGAATEPEPNMGIVNCFRTSRVQRSWSSSTCCSMERRSLGRRDLDGRCQVGCMLLIPTPTTHPAVTRVRNLKPIPVARRVSPSCPPPRPPHHPAGQCWRTSVQAIFASKIVLIPLVILFRNVIHVYEDAVGYASEWHLCACQAAT